MISVSILAKKKIFYLEESEIDLANWIGKNERETIEILW